MHCGRVRSKDYKTSKAQSFHSLVLYRGQMQTPVLSSQLPLGCFTSTDKLLAFIKVWNPALFSEWTHQDKSNPTKETVALSLYLIQDMQPSVSNLVKKQNSLKLVFVYGLPPDALLLHVPHLRTEDSSTNSTNSSLIYWSPTFTECLKCVVRIWHIFRAEEIIQSLKLGSQPKCQDSHTCSQNAEKWVVLVTYAVDGSSAERVTNTWEQQIWLERHLRLEPDVIYHCPWKYIF